MSLIGRARRWLATYLAADDRYAAAANTGAFVVWSNQPFYPLYVAWFVGWQDCWPALLTLLSTPFFVAVPILERRRALAGRFLFAGAGAANTLLSLKAFGAGSSVGWFFIPCFLVAAGLFRPAEWKVALAAATGVAACLLVSSQVGAPLHAFTADQLRSLSRLNLYSVTGLSIYLVYAAVRARLSTADGDAQEPSGDERAR